MQSQKLITVLLLFLVAVDNKSLHAKHIDIDSSDCGPFSGDLEKDLVSEPPQCEFEPKDSTVDVSRRLANSVHREEGIPKIIHQSWKTAEVPEKFLDWQRSWRKNHPEWKLVPFTYPQPNDPSYYTVLQTISVS